MLKSVELNTKEKIEKEEIESRINDADEIMAQWWDTGNDCFLSYMHEMTTHLYNTGVMDSPDVSLSQSDKDEVVFDDMIAYDSLYIIDKHSSLYKKVVSIAQYEHNAITDYLANLCNYSKDEVICTDIVVNGVSCADTIKYF